MGAAVMHLTTAQHELMQCPNYVCPACHRSHGGATYDEYGEEVDTTEADAIHLAAHCCLWKTHDHPARVRIAERVEAGSNWAEAIEGETL